jgi:formamidopyrimidine-DNA glycosylase
MSGSWRISKTKIKEKHTHIQFKTCNSKGEIIYLGYIDPRRFGNMHFLTNDEANKWLTRLGEDVSTSKFTAEYILEKCKRYPNKKIKPYLLEQNHFAGVGNYMASEICARAKVLPDRVASTISKKEATQLIKATKVVLDDAIKTNGTTFSGGYQDAFGEKGAGVQNLVVFYQDTCKMCNKTKVKKITLAGRGTYYCPSCQK